MASRWKCEECEAVVDDASILTASNPFDADGGCDAITGCPECRAVQSFERLCDEPGCTRYAGAGTPYPGGYKHHCGAHPPVNERKGEPR